MGSGIILLLGNEESPMNYPDNQYSFRQDSSFLYFFGLDFPSLAAVIDIDQGKECVFGDDLTVDDIIWTGPQPALREKYQKVGVPVVLGKNGIEKIIELDLNESELAQFKKSLDHVKHLARQVDKLLN